MYQIANLYELLGDMGQAVEWYFQVIGLVPTDPAILQKMATIYDNDGDKQQAYQYYFDSYRYLDLFDTIQALAKKNSNSCIVFLPSYHVDVIYLKTESKSNTK